MNRALPPGDRGSRGADPLWAPRRGWFVSGACRLVGGATAAARRQGSLTAIAPAWAALLSLGLMPQPGRPGPNVGARSREAGRSGATSARHGGL